jgi:hypothetical protein
MVNAMQLATIAGIAGGIIVDKLSKNLNTMIILLNLNSIILGRAIQKPVIANNSIVAKKI